MITPFQALLLGVVEGLTEFLPISSTGHLILTAHALRLDGDAVKTFEVVIQSGALLAVVGLYGARLTQGWRLLRNLCLSFLPAAVAGLLLHRAITRALFSLTPVIAALALGGLVMIVVDRLVAVRHGTRTTLAALTVRDALLIGLAQVLALWPGTSRAMVTIVAGLLLGLPAAAAAEYSFLLAVPTVGAAALLEAVRGGTTLLRLTGWESLLIGFTASAVVAALAIAGFVRYLTRHGLAVFGWYRLGLAALVWGVMG